MKKVKAIYFDMGGVLMEVSGDYNRHSVIERSFQSEEVQAFTGLNFDVSDYSAFLDKQIEERYRDPSRPEQPDAWISTRNDLEAFFGKPVPYKVLRSIFWDYVKCMDQYFSMKPNVLETLTVLRSRGLIIGLISNVYHPSIIYKQKFTEWGILDFFNPIVFSSDLRYKKPAPEIFKYALDYHKGLKPEQTVFVGDTYNIDVLGAHSVGMVPVWINQKNSDSNPLGVIEIQGVQDLLKIIET